MNRKTRKLVRLSFFLAASVLLNYIEAVLLQFPSIAPGVKLGLANCVGLVVLYFYGPVDFFSVGFLRVLLVALFIYKVKIYIEKMSIKSVLFYLHTRII